MLGANPGMSGSIADVGSGPAVARWFDEGLEALGTIDVLVNNAGISGPRAPVEEVDDDDWYRVIDVNLNGMFHCIKRAVPVMKAQGQRRDRQHLDRIHQGRAAAQDRLRHLQVRGGRHDPEPGARARPLRHPLQRHPARNHRQPARAGG